MVTCVCFCFFFLIWEYVKNALFRCGLKGDQCSLACVYVHKYYTETHICDLFSHAQPEDILVNGKPCTWQWSHKLIMPGHEADANMRMNSSKDTFLVMYVPFVKPCTAVRMCLYRTCTLVYNSVNLASWNFLGYDSCLFSPFTSYWPPPLNWYWAHTPGFHPLCY